MKVRKNHNQQKQARKANKGDKTESLDSSRKSKDPSNSLAKASLEQSEKPYFFLLCLQKKKKRHVRKLGWGAFWEKKLTVIMCKSRDYCSVSQNGFD